MRKNKEIAQDCETCTNHGTMDCPTSALCYSKQNHPYWMNKPMKENRVKIAISGIPLDRLEAICAAEKDGKLYTAHDVAVILANAIGDDCACNINSNDEWLPQLCELQEACPEPVGVACWEQYLKHRAEAEKALEKEQGHDD